MKRKLAAALLMTGMLAAPAFADTELAGVVQANRGSNIIVGAEGRFYAVPSDSVFLLHNQRIDPRALQPGMPVQIYMQRSLRSAEIGNDNRFRNDYRQDWNYDRNYYQYRWR